MKKDVLIIGLGNPLMGDDGVGYHAVQRLADDPRRPPNVEVLWGGTDLLRPAPQMEGRRQIFLIDAIFESGDSGTLQIYRDDFSALVDQQKHVHHLSVVQAIELLKILSPSLKNTSFILLLAASANCMPAKN